MQRNQASKSYILMVFLMLFTACSSPHFEKPNKFNLTAEERLWLEKFFRHFMLYNTAIYTLTGSKPLTSIHLLYEDKPQEELREQNREGFIYFLLNRNNKKDMEFYKKLSSVEKEEKAYLIAEKDFIYPIEDLWDKWEKIKDRFPIKRKFILVKKERPRDRWKETSPEYKAIYDVFFVDVFKTALVIQENYELFKQVIGYDFDPLEVVFELENNSSDFWDKITEKDAWKHAPLWGILYGFGKENAFAYIWKGRHIREPHRSEKEKLLSTTIKQWHSSKNRPSYDDKGAFTLSNFTIPIFASFVEDDPIVAKYEAEKEKIRKLYQGKDFVDFTLELLTALPGDAS